MYLEKKKPITASQRHLIKLNTNSWVSKKSLLKGCIKGLKTSSGRNNKGKITIWHKGGGHKKKYRFINFYRYKKSKGIVFNIEYDPNRNSSIAAVFEIAEKNFFYIIASKGQQIGDIIESGKNSKLNLGSSLPLSSIPSGSFVNCVSKKWKKNSQFSRAAGAYAYLKYKVGKHAVLELNSGIEKKFPLNCYATLGIVSNDLFFLTQWGKAGRSRWLNIRPSVRGVAMNPIDHPHGGGEGKKSGKGKTPWGKTSKPGPHKKVLK